MNLNELDKLVAEFREFNITISNDQPLETSVFR